MSGSTPGSQNDVLTTATHFLVEFENYIRLEMPDCSVIFDDQLSYVTALKLLRQNDDFHGSETDNLPLFAYKRTSLKKEEQGIGKRSVKARNLNVTLPSGKVVQYGIVYGTFDIMFAYYTKSIELLEKFEVVYGNNLGLSGQREIEVNMGELGDFKYFLKWNELEDFDVQSDEDNYFKALAGSVTVRGFFYIFAGEASIIREVQALIKGVDKVPLPNEEELLADISIVE